MSFNDENIGNLNFINISKISKNINGYFDNNIDTIKNYSKFKRIGKINSKIIKYKY